MFFILLQIVFSSAFTLIIKWAQQRKTEDVITIGMVNYIVAAISIAPFFLSNPSELSGSAIWTGGSMGAIYFMAFFLAIYAIKTVGASATTVVSVLSILFPIILAAMVWDEIPDRMQIIGIGVALIALLLIGLKSRDGKLATQKRNWQTPVILIGFYLLCGCSRLSQEAFKHLSVPDQRPTFVFTAFVVAGIPSLVMLLYRQKSIRRTELAFGVGLGLSNMLQTHLILHCLEYYPGYFVFPVVSAGAIVLTTFVATGMMHEKLTRNAYIGIGLAVIALFMLH